MGGHLKANMMYYHIYLYHSSKYNYHCVITQILQNGQTLGQFFELLYLPSLWRNVHTLWISTSQRSISSGAQQSLKYRSMALRPAGVAHGQCVSQEVKFWEKCWFNYIVPKNDAMWWYKGRGCHIVAFEGQLDSKGACLKGFAYVLAHRVPYIIDRVSWV